MRGLIIGMMLALTMASDGVRAERMEHEHQVGLRNMPPPQVEASPSTVVSFKDSVERVQRGDYSRVEGGAVFFVIVIGGLLVVWRLYKAP